MPWLGQPWRATGPDGLGPPRAPAWHARELAARGGRLDAIAATEPKAKGGVYYGPDKLSEIRGYPAVAKIPPQALDAKASARLWTVSEALTGLSFGT